VGEAGGDGVINFGVTERKIEELEQRMQKCGLLEKDLEEKFIRSGSAGGQKVNKTSTCVQLKHIPTGLAAKVQKSRSQGLNRFYARRQLCELLENKQLSKDSPKAKEMKKIRKQKDRRKRRKKISKQE
jgi:protein subunit release factor B